MSRALWPQRSAWAAFAAFLGLCVAAASIATSAKYLAGDQLRAWFEGAGAWAPVAFVVAKALTLVIAPLPGLPLYAMAGALFGTWWASCYLALGDFLGAALAFAIARRFGRPIVRRFLGASHAGLLDAVLERLGTPKGLFAACMLCTGAGEIVAWGAGLTTIRYAHFALVYNGTGLVTTLALAWLGDVAFSGGG